MKAIYVKGDWMRSIVQPNLILKFIHKEQLGVINNYDEDKDYNITFYILRCKDNCLDLLVKEFPNYEFILKGG